MSCADLDRAALAEMRERMAAYAPDPADREPRRYPGYPRVELPRPRARVLASLDRTLRARRCRRDLEPAQPPIKALARMLAFAHGPGAVPSAGGFAALELYVLALVSGPLPPAAYHYDRAGHHLALLREATRATWQPLIPSLADTPAAPLAFVLGGDLARVSAKYGERAERFLLLEAGHLMQNLCLLAASLGLSVVPLGGVLDREVAAALALPPTDRVLYAAACGTIGS